MITSSNAFSNYSNSQSGIPKVNIHRKMMRQVAVLLCVAFGKLFMSHKKNKNKTRQIWNRSKRAIQFEHVSDFSSFYVYSHLVRPLICQSPPYTAVSLVYSLPALHRVSFIFILFFFCAFTQSVFTNREQTIIRRTVKWHTNFEFVLQAKRWEEFPNVTLTFDCTDRPLGFYADQEFECMLFHMCDEDGRRIPYMCGSGTAFNQQYRICDWIHNFDCKEANKWYERKINHADSRCSLIDYLWKYWFLIICCAGFTWTSWLTSRILPSQSKLKGNFADWRKTGLIFWFFLFRLPPFSSHFSSSSSVIFFSIFSFHVLFFFSFLACVRASPSPHYSSFKKKNALLYISVT